MNDNSCLSTSALYATPQYINWAQAYTQHRWELVYPDSNALSLQQIQQLIGRSFHNTKQARSEAQQYFEEHLYLIDPITCYWYELPDFDADAQKAQSMLIAAYNSCTVVMLEQKPALALTGCGMDFSWDICAAYMLLGYLPPFAFCDLPNIDTCKNKVVKQACIKSCTIVCQQAQAKLKYLESL